MNKKNYVAAQGAARADKHLARVVDSEETDSLVQDTDSLTLPDETDSKISCVSITLLKSSGVMPSKSTSESFFKSKESMRQTIKIELPQVVWTVEVEPDKDVEGRIVTTFSTNSSTGQPLSSEVSSCSVSDLESVIKRNLSQLVVEDKCGTLEGRIEYRLGKETETERCARKILCRLFKIKE
jgi:hypothetical protein